MLFTWLVCLMEWKGAGLLNNAILETSESSSDATYLQSGTVTWTRHFF